MKIKHLFKWTGLVTLGAVMVFASFIYFNFYSPGTSGKYLLSKERVEDLHTNYKSKFIDIDGVRVHYRDEGTGYPLVLLHGLSTSLHVWNGWTKELEDKHRIIRLDLPGFGLTDFPEAKDQISSIDFYTSFINKFLDALEIENCNMAGNSLGGWITWEYAATYPERIHKIVLLNAAGYLKQDTKSRTAAIMRNPLAKRLVTTGVPRFLVKHAAKKSFADNNLISKELIEQYFDIVNREGNLMALINLVHLDLIPNEEKIKQVQAPTLILWGDKDRIISVDNAYWFKKDIPNSQLIVYPGIGHVPNSENTHVSATDASKFLLLDEEEEIVAKDSRHS